VFTRKAMTDLNYVACAQQLLGLRPRIFPQFATHNALTVATLRRAFDEMLVDPVFLEEGRRAGIQLKPMSGDRLQDLVARVGSFPPPLIEKARQAREKPS